MSAFAFKQFIFTQHDWLDHLTSRPPRLQGRSYLIAKRLLDLCVVLPVLPLVTPVLLLCAVLIKLEDPHGPALFIQQHTGKGGRRFGMYKFRTMVANAEELKQQLASSGLFISTIIATIEVKQPNERCTRGLARFQLTSNGSANHSYPRQY